MTNLLVLFVLGLFLFGWLASLLSAARDRRRQIAVVLGPIRAEIEEHRRIGPVFERWDRQDPLDPILSTRADIRSYRAWLRSQGALTAACQRELAYDGRLVLVRPEE